MPLTPVTRRLAVGLLLALPAWLHAQPPSQPAPEPIRIALIEGLSGPAGLAGEAVWRNLLWATERVNARGGVSLPGGARPLRIERFDSKGQTEEALSALRSASDRGIAIVAQGNSSAAASALIDAIGKHNERQPAQRMLLLNYAAVDPALTNERCSFWHFRFDAHADMRLNALMGLIREDRALQSIYLIGQDYSFGQGVLRQARRLLEQQRPDVRIVGDELHPMSRIKDFLPYAAKIKASGAQAVLTGNWGNDLTLLVKAAREAGFEGRFYTFYGNALGAPAAIGEAGVGQVLAVTEWFPNAPGQAGKAFYQAFRQRFPLSLKGASLPERMASSKCPSTTVTSMCAACAGSATPHRIKATCVACRKRLGISRVICWAASATASGAFLVSLILRAAVAYSCSTVPAKRATSLAIWVRRPRPSSMRRLKVCSSLGSGSSKKARSSATSMIWAFNSSAVPPPAPSGDRPTCMYATAIFCRSGMFFSRYLSASLICSANRRRRPARFLAAATSGSSNTSMVTASCTSTSAGKPIRVWPPLLISISSGSSPKVQAV